MRHISFGWQIAIVALLAGCGGGNPVLAPERALPAARGIAAPASATRGIYVALGEPGTGPAIYGYASKNRKNKPAICTAMSGIGADDIAVDNQGNLMIATGGGEEVLVLQGPDMCGSLLGQINTNGIPFDVASADAANGEIVVGNLYSNTGLGNVVVCTLSGGCTKTLTNSSIVSLYGVARAKNGDCWASASGFSGTVLVYFKKCSGSGQVATGFTNTSAGGLDIDGHGNLISIDRRPRNSWSTKAASPTARSSADPSRHEGAPITAT